MSAADPQNINQAVSTPAPVQPAQAQPAHDPMAAFKDLQMPDPVSWWPLAWGWWILTTLVLLLLIAAGIYVYRRQQRLKAKKQAIYLIENLAEGSSPIELNTLLKQAFLSYYPRAQVASLSGQAWFDFLSTQLQPSEQTEFEPLKTFCYNLYQPGKSVTNQDKQLIVAYLNKVLPVSAQTFTAEAQHV